MHQQQQEMMQPLIAPTLLLLLMPACPTYYIHAISQCLIHFGLKFRAGSALFRELNSWWTTAEHLHLTVATQASN